jgi:release factor glutamine methyltransferase
VIRRLVKEAPQFLAPGAWLVFEIGLGQGPSVAKGLERSPEFDRIATHVDGNGEIRVISARRAGA